MIALRPTLLALGAALLSGGVAHAQFMPPATITDGMTSRPAVRPPTSPDTAYAPSVTYGAANLPPAAYPAPASAYAPSAYGPATGVGAGAYPAYTPAVGTPGYAATYTPPSAVYASYPGDQQTMAVPPPAMPAGYGMAPPLPSAGYPVPPPPPRIGGDASLLPGPAPTATPLITTAVSEQQNPPLAAAGLAPAYGYGNGDAAMGMMAPPSTPSLTVPPVAYAPLPQYTPDARTMTPLPASYTDMARQRVAEGDYARAQTGLEEAIKVNPFDPAALNNLAVAKAEQGQYNEAVSLLERATRLAPGDAEIAANLQRMRGFLNSYAMSGVAEPAARAVVPVAPGNMLPPPPPPLWTRPGTVTITPTPVAVAVPVTQTVVYTPVSYGTTVTASPQGYYTSGACQNGVRRTASGMVEVCQTTR